MFKYTNGTSSFMSHKEKLVSVIFLVLSRHSYISFYNKKIITNVLNFNFVEHRCGGSYGCE
ncbi:hypothetical protein Syun_017111 [Stephania yunnanensis]|uniref:Uncharacterized protein n=1 Tax=Stephania yunnanensis TaxID=152371 RepID=A0AAP0J6G5_9MAGN